MNTTSQHTPLDYFPIRILSEQTGVNSVTLRAWERRYGLLNPVRTEKGHRLYCSQDVERVKRILYWITQGVSVGKVRALLDATPQETRSQIEETQWPQWQNQFMSAVEALNQGTWERLFLDASKQYPLKILLNKGLLPVLQKLRNQKHTRVAYLCLQSSLVELMASIRPRVRQTNKRLPFTLVINIDNSVLMSHLVNWSLLDKSRPYQYIEGARSAADVVDLVQTLQPVETILVAESTAQVEAEKWLESFALYAPNALHIIGAGFWLGILGTQRIEGVQTYSDVASYLTRNA